VDPHRLAEERSIAYHRVIAARLLEDPRSLAAARARVGAWAAGAGSELPRYVRGWQDALARSPAEIAALLTDPGERARELRQSTPFAGVLAPRERWEIWRAVAARATRDA
jgi:hypothetical protein